MRARHRPRSSADSTPPPPGCRRRSSARSRPGRNRPGRPRRAVARVSAKTTERQARAVAIGRADRRQTVRQPDPPALVVAPQIGGGAGDLHRREPVDRQARSRQRDRRRDQLAPRHAAETLDRQRVAAHRARDRERQRPVHVAVADDLRPGEQLGSHLAGQREGGRIEPVRRDRAEIDDLGAVGAGRVHDHEADAAEPAVPRLDARRAQRRWRPRHRPRCRPPPGSRRRPAPRSRSAPRRCRRATTRPACGSPSSASGACRACAQVTVIESTRFV